MKHCTTALFAFLFTLGATTTAQPGSLDATFGTGGKVTTDFGSLSDRGYAVAIQPDGKIVVAGESNNGSDRDLAIARYDPDGTLDNTFGTEGKVTTDFAGADDYGWSVAIQPDGKIVVAGNTGSLLAFDFAVVRYNADGTLDNSFGTDGKVTTNLGAGENYGQSVAIQPNGKIVVAGASGSGPNYDFALARYNADGTLDNGFGTDGKVTTDFGTGPDFGKGVAIQPDGKIVVAGESINDFALARYNTDGTLDNSFGANGLVTTDFGSTIDHGQAIAIQPDGKIVVAGESNFDFAVARYNTDGTLDNSFGLDGKVATDFGSDYDRGWSVAIQLDGKIIVAGYMLNGPDHDFALARYNTDGTLDISFSADGKVTTAIGTSDDYGRSVAIPPDGKIVLAGLTGSDTGTGSDLALARYLSGLNVGVIEFSLTNNAPLIYPNPIDKPATLAYTLQHAETISIHLLDMQGKTVGTFVEGEEQAAGEHQLSIDLPVALPSGTYLIAISSPKGKLTVQVVK